MKKKLLTLVLTGVLSLAVLGGCGSDKDKAAETTPTQAATPTEAPKENNDEEEVSGDIEDFRAPVDDEGQGRMEYEGYYIEPDAGRCAISIESTDGVNYSISAEWSASASEMWIWEMVGAYEESSGYLNYNDCTFVVRTTDEDGSYSDDVRYTDGSGKFWFNGDDMLLWESDQSDVDSINGETPFEKVEAEQLEIGHPAVEAPEGLVSLEELAGSWVLDGDPNDTLEIVAYDGDPYSGSFVHTDASGTTQIGEIALYADEAPDGTVGYWYYFYLDADEVWTGYCIPDQAGDQMAMGQGGDPLYVRVP